MVNRPVARTAWISITLLLGTLHSTAGAMKFKIPKPDGKESFITDMASLIEQADSEKINATCKKLLQEKATPIIVVTIPSMTAVGGTPDMRIETFARLLFDDWGIGHEKLGGKTWNTGILLLVSKGDRKARIELGAGWKRDKDDLCARIMEEQIIARFKKNRFSAGIAAGVDSLDKMARGLELPKVPRPWWHYALVAGFIGLAIFTVVSLIRRGSSGWAWLLWGAVFAVIGYLLYTALRSRGGGGGSSFGGGFSGGGGATGSW